MSVAAMKTKMAVSTVKVTKANSKKVTTVMMAIMMRMREHAVNGDAIDKIATTIVNYFLSIVHLFYFVVHVRVYVCVVDRTVNADTFPISVCKQ
jgi:hypothetical protein